MTDKIKESFIRAFRANHSGFRGECNCGKEFYNPADCWDFDDSEIKFLEQSDAIELDHDVQYVEFNRREYVIDCDCWKHIASNMIQYVDEHKVQIVNYLSNERERMIFEAEQLKLVEILSTPDPREQEFDDDIPF